MNEPKPLENHMTNAELADLFDTGKLWIGGTTDPMPGVTQQIIAALRQSSPTLTERRLYNEVRELRMERHKWRASEQSNDMKRIIKAVVQIEWDHWVLNGSAIKVEDAPLVLLDVQQAFSAAEAEGHHE